VSRETLLQLTLIVFQLLSEHVFNQKFKPMPKNVLFLLKNRRAPLSFGGWEPQTPH